MAYIVDNPYAWDVDKSLHAHTTKVAIQGNLQAGYDNSGSDIDGAMLCLSTGYHTEIPAAAWAWSTLIYQPVRTLAKQGSTGYRDITVEVLGELAAAGKTVLRAFLLARPGLLIDAASGLVADYDYADLEFNLAAPVRVDGTVTPSNVVTFTLADTMFQGAFLRFGIQGDKNLYIRSIRIKEGT